MEIQFYKYQGTGNDFVMIDNRQLTFPKENTKLIHFLCDRRFGIGADGLILLENTDGYDFKMVYYNADGNESTMCGNGGRCLVAFAQQLGVITNQTHFIAIDGAHFATVENEIVSLQMIDVSQVDITNTHVFMNTGSPHHVQEVQNIETLEIKKEGAAIRFGELYATKGGANVNFVSPTATKDTFRVRTYERGVEDETLSCGTGVTAVAIAMKATQKTTSETIALQTQGGLLEVSFKEENGIYKNVFLKGPAQLVFKGSINATT